MYFSNTISRPTVPRGAAPGRTDGRTNGMKEAVGNCRAGRRKERKKGKVFFFEYNAGARWEIEERNGGKIFIYEIGMMKKSVTSNNFHPFYLWAAEIYDICGCCIEWTVFKPKHLIYAVMLRETEREREVDKLDDCLSR